MGLQVQCIRERTEQQEKERLSPYAAKSSDARRERWEEECPMRTKFSGISIVFCTVSPYTALSIRLRYCPTGDH